MKLEYVALIYDSESQAPMLAPSVRIFNFCLQNKLTEKIKIYGLAGCKNLLASIIHFNSTQFPTLMLYLLVTKPDT